MKDVSKYIKKLKTDTGYKFSEYSNSTVLSTSFAISTLHLTQNKIPQREELINNLASKINKEGYFVDDNYKYHSHPHHGPDYVLPQFTFFALTALDILGYQVHEIPFLNSLSEKKLSNLLNSFLEKSFWATSNQLMFLLFFLAYSKKYNITEGQELYINQIFDFLKENQNSENGFWGAEATPNIYHQAYGAAHVYIFYDYFKKEIPYLNKIIDTLLKMHTKNGLIQTLEGGACEDYDIVEIYLRCLKQTDYRKHEILDKLELMHNTISKSENKDGGFTYKIYQPKNLKERLFKIYPALPKYKYSSWDYMQTPVYKSDIWATFFRVMTLKEIRYIIKKEQNYNSLKLPGWGYIN